MASQEEAIHKRKVIKWLAIGFGSLLFVITAFIVIANLLDGDEAQAAKAEISEYDLNNAKLFAQQFVTDAGTFGISEEATDPEALAFVKGQLADRLGSYGNSAFGVSRGERYFSLIERLDSNGQEDVTEYFANELNGYFPDWSGQISSYRAEDVLITPGEPYESGGVTLLPIQASFTSVITIFSDEDVISSEGSWRQYTGEKFQTVELVLAQQPSGLWKIWSIDDLADSPYMLATWSEPDWRKESPNTATLIAVD